MDPISDDVPALVGELKTQWGELSRELAGEAEMLDRITDMVPVLLEECGPSLAQTKPAAADLARRLAVYVSALQRFLKALPDDTREMP